VHVLRSQVCRFLLQSYGTHPDAQLSTTVIATVTTIVIATITTTAIATITTTAIATVSTFTTATIATFAIAARVKQRGPAILLDVQPP
jgi:hypothetical protein